MNTCFVQANAVHREKLKEPVLKCHSCNNPTIESANSCSPLLQQHHYCFKNTILTLASDKVKGNEKHLST